MNLNLTNLLYRAPAIILVLTVHEFSHGVIAYKLGDYRAKADGRLSLNPFKHIDWFGLAAMLLFGFGWAKPVTVDPRSFKNPKVDMALTAAAGPISNIFFAFILFLVYVPLVYLTSSTGFTGVLQYFVYICIIMNLSLGFFNMLPIPPLDGSKIFGALLPDRFYFAFTNIGNVGMIVLIVLLYLGIVDTIIGPLITFSFNGMVTVAQQIFSFLL